jgi:hypothetical protein
VAKGDCESCRTGINSKEKRPPSQNTTDPPSLAAEESKETAVEVVDMPETADVAQLDPAASSHQLQPAEADRSSTAADNSMEVSHAASPIAVPPDDTDKDALDAEPAASSVVSPRLEPSHEGVGGGDESIPRSEGRQPDSFPANDGSRSGTKD